LLVVSLNRQTAVKLVNFTLLTPRNSTRNSQLSTRNSQLSLNSQLATRAFNSQLHDSHYTPTPFYSCIFTDLSMVFTGKFTKLTHSIENSSQKDIVAPGIAHYFTFPFIRYILIVTLNLVFYLPKKQRIISRQLSIITKSEAIHFSSLSLIPTYRACR